MNLIFSVLITLISFFYQNLNDWELKKNQDNVKVFTRSLDNGIKEFLGETILNSTMDSVFSWVVFRYGDILLGLAWRKRGFLFTRKVRV